MAQNKASSSKIISISVLLSVVLSLGAGYFYLQSLNSNSADFGQKVVATFDNDTNAEALIAKLNAYAQKKQEEANKPQKVSFEISTENAPMEGSVDAPVTIVEFSEYECPYCQRHVVQTLPDIQDYIDAGKVKYFFRDFIVHGAGAETRAELAYCVRDQKGDEGYFAAHNLLFGDAFGIEDTDTLVADLVKIASEKIEGLDATALTSCITAKTHAEQIAKNSADGKQYGVTGTPAFFVNGTFVKGAYPFTTFQEIIDAELAQ